MRADFEVWECVSNEGPQTDPVWLMYDAETNTFPLDKIQERWKCWQASRESLVIELPKSWPEDRGYTAMDAEEVIAAIHAAGVKAK